MNPNEQDNILYLKSTGSTTGEEVVVSARNPELSMETHNNRPLIVTMIIIGIIIIILLLSPRYGYNRAVQYGYGNTNMFAASAVPFTNNYTYTTTRTNVPGTYSIVRTYPQPKSYSYTSYTTPTYYSYPQTTYQPYPGETVFPDGCTMTSPYSTTTGEPCS